jgi:TDG/mug DNA glycosylase family protein
VTLRNGPPGRESPSGRSPSKAELEAARGRTVPDVLARGLDVVFVGINPGLWSGALGHHFARPGNRFWKTLHRAGFTDRQLAPHEERELLRAGLGVTNLVLRTTARADELTPEEIRAGASGLERRLARYRPHTVAVLGIGAYRTGFGRPAAVVGPQEETLGGSRLWVLPNPSGLNAHYQLPDLVARFVELRRAVRGS